jgi:hypothetical protein
LIRGRNIYVFAISRYHAAGELDTLRLQHGCQQVIGSEDADTPLQGVEAQGAQAHRCF